MAVEEHRRYLAYLLRLWEIDDERGVVWRASLESPHTGERHGFPDLKALLAFLEQKTGFVVETDESKGGSL
mgnify:FL=1